MIWLAFETSCDETSVAVGQGEAVWSNLVTSQALLHAEYGGVVPELAAREHLRNLPRLTRAALRSAEVEVSSLALVAATRGPGLPSALLVGCKAAQSMAFGLRRPFLGVHHHEAHLYSPWITGKPLRADFKAFEPNVSLIVSGGHTLLVEVEAELRHRVLGGTVDDAAGECFDKIAKLIGLPYPGGPELDRLAADGNAARYEFPRPLRDDPGDDFSFSGLKTSVRYFLRDHPAVLENGQDLRDLCASAQAAIVDVLVTKTVRAARRLGVGCVTASGGVTCNSAFRRELRQACDRVGLAVRLAEPALCTDNAAMIGILAARRWSAGATSADGDAEILAGWKLDQLGLDLTRAPASSK
jgi:N6-L-threonylcarbamoyladenine synthase